MHHVQSSIHKDTTPDEVVTIFHDHFTPKLLDKLVITDVVNTVLAMLRVYCHDTSIQTLMLAIDGVPSKGKMIEQRQRRYLGAITSEYEKFILKKYTKYLNDQDDYVYWAISKPIEWSRNKITPGTAFMHKLVQYLRSDNVQSAMKSRRPNLTILISDMYEVGEGETKIVNYVNKFLEKTEDTVVIYSPDADMILLCILLPVQTLFMLRHNQQTSEYDLIDVHMLKRNIGHYINNNPTTNPENFDVERINRDMVCLSTLFGNDFVPRMETLNVKKGFQNILDAYLATLIELKPKGYYLIARNGTDAVGGTKSKALRTNGSKTSRSTLTRSKTQAKIKLGGSKNTRGKTKPIGGNVNSLSYRLNLTFLRSILQKLLPEELDFIQHNNLYNQYVTIGQIKYVFNYMEINEENLVSTVSQFKQEYGNLTNLIRQNGNYSFYAKNELFMTSLKRAVNLTLDDKVINTTYLTNQELLNLIRGYYRKNRDFPRLNINLNTYSKDIDSPLYKNRLKQDGIKPTDLYQRDLYKFRHMLNEYYVKFNAQPLILDEQSVPHYYNTYFGVDLTDSKGNLTKGAKKVVQDYLEGIVWVFNYYYNERTYVNTWYYEHERAPLLQHLLMYLNNLDLASFKKMFDDLDKYQVDDLTTYFTPVEQLMNVSPMTDEIVSLLPANYRKYLASDEVDPFLTNYFVNIKDLTKQLWAEKVSKDVDCHSIPYFNKCLISHIVRPSESDDKRFLAAIRKIKPTDVSKRRSKNTVPKY